jgi:hypothetical protein
MPHRFTVRSGNRRTEATRHERTRGILTGEVMTTRMTLCSLVLLLAVLIVPPANAQPPGPAREIIQITDDLYRARNGNWYTIFLVTSEGIILGDPINPAFAAHGSTQELDSDSTYRCAMSSTATVTSITPAAVRCSPTPHQFIAQENMRAQHGRPLSAYARRHDRPRQHRRDQPQATSTYPPTQRTGICGMGPSFFGQYDRDGDGVITPAELQADIHPPDIYYSERMQTHSGRAKRFN